MLGELFPLILSLADELLKKTPDYEQRKKEQYYKMVSRYEKENGREISDRDDLLIDNLRDELRLFIKTFVKEIQG